MSPTGTPRLFVALDPGPDAAGLLDAAVRLASRLEREMVALFIENAALLAAAGLPFARLVTSRATAPLALDPATTQRAFKVMAEELRRQLARRAAEQRVRWSFELFSGDLGRLVTASGDLVLSAPRSEPAAAGDGTGLICPVVLLAGRRGPVVVLFEGNADALEIGRRLALDEDEPLVVMALGDGLATAEERAAQAAGRLGPRIEVVAAETGERLSAILAARRPGIVLLDTCQGLGRWRAAVEALSARRGAGHSGAAGHRA